jgi:hypothetical protein
MDFQSAFDNATGEIDKTMSTQLSSVFSWKSVSGSLVKVSSSSIGYVWGFNSASNIYYCQLPCTGNWKQYTIPGLTQVYDLTTDSTNVYILASGSNGLQLFVVSANTNGEMTSITVPFSATSIFSTQTYIWAQDNSNQKQKCPKPCTMSNWIANTDKSVKITSASNGNLYGVDPQGKAMRTDETMNTGWLPISQFSNMNLKSVIGDIDQTTLFAIDSNYKAFRCETNCKDPLPMDTEGYSPLTMTADPVNQEVWMTTSETGDSGNIFSQSEKSNYSNVMNDLNPLDKQRDEIVKDVSSEYEKQTVLMVANKQMNELFTFVKNIFKFSEKSGDIEKQRAGHFREQIGRAQGQLDQVKQNLPLLQQIVILLTIVVVIYLIGSWLGTIVHFIAIGVLGVGVYLILKNKNDSSSM